MAKNKDKTAPPPSDSGKVNPNSTMGVNTQKVVEWDKPYHERLD